MIFSAGAVSTFAIPPFSFFLTIFFLGFGIYKISFLSSLRQTFLTGWVLGFGWFLFGLYWIGSAFIVADTYHIYFMPFAVILLPSLLAIFWGLAFLFAKLLTKNKASSLVMVILFLSLLDNRAILLEDTRRLDALLPTALTLDTVCSRQLSNLFRR